MPRLSAKDWMIVLLVAAPFAVPLALSVELPEGMGTATAAAAD